MSDVWMPPQGQLTPEMMQQFQQYQDQQKQQQQRQAMAQALMQNQASPQTPNSGIANAGGDIMGALVQRRMQQQADPTNQIMQQRYGMSPGAANNVLHPSMLSKLFSMGGG